MTGQTACTIWKAAAVPVAAFDNVDLEPLKGALLILAALKAALWIEVVRDENGALSIISRDFTTLTAHVQWRTREAAAHLPPEELNHLHHAHQP
jgi:hypothetical protein